MLWRFGLGRWQGGQEQGKYCAVEKLFHKEFLKTRR